MHFTDSTAVLLFFKDTLMLPCIWTAHKDKTIWSDTEMFLPERFLDDKGNLLKKDYTLGFGNGIKY